MVDTPGKRDIGKESLFKSKKYFLLFLGYLTHFENFSLFLVNENHDIHIYFSKVENKPLKL